MKIVGDNVLRHNFAIWVMGRKPGWFKPQRYMYRCLRCKWAFVVNDDYRGSVRIAADRAGECTPEEEARRLATFADGPCPGYKPEQTPVAEARISNVVQMRRENRAAKPVRDAHAM